MLKQSLYDANFISESLLSVVTAAPKNIVYYIANFKYFFLFIYILNNEKMISIRFIVLLSPEISENI